MNVLLVAPVLIPLITAIVALLLRGNLPVQRVVSIAGTLALLVTSVILLTTVRADGIQAVQMGDWAAPFGITLVADLLSAIMLVLTGIMAVCVAVYAIVTIDPERESFGYHPLYHILLMGICGAFLTGDVFNLYVWFEVMLIASFVLLALGGERGQLEGSVKYVTINLIASAIFLAAIGLLYGMVGTLNMADLGQKLSDIDQPGLVTTVAMLFMVAFGIKAAVFPAFFWLPASYHTPPVAISAIFAGLLTKVGVYSLIRVFTLIFSQDSDYTQGIILIVAGLTMLTGVLGSLAQTEIRRLFSFLVISHIGYMLMGLGLFSAIGLAGGIYYLIHDITAKTNLFLISGMMTRLGGSHDLRKLGGLYVAYPAISIAFLVTAFALAGMPPFSGFFAKIALVRAGVELDEYLIVAVAVVVSLLTLIVLARVWSQAFWRNREEVEENGAAHGGDPARISMTSPAMLTLLGPIAVLAVITTALGLGADFIYTLSHDAAEQLLDPQRYIDAVLESDV